MGYYTNYDLTNLTDEQIEKVNEMSGYSFTNQYVSDSVKWYSWNETMKEVSKLFPDQPLIIEGEGEEAGDIWKAYFKNGKSQIMEAKITFEEFDESKLS